MLRWGQTGMTTTNPGFQAHLTGYHLTKKETELLNVLRDHAGQCLTREFLLRTIWGYGPGVRTRTLDVHIQRLRRKMQELGITGQIQTILGCGYCWQAIGNTMGSFSPA